MRHAHNFKDRTGEIYTNNEGCTFKIIDYINAQYCNIQFEDGLILKGIKFGEIKSGKIKNPNYPSVYGIGYLGQGVYERSYKGIRTPAYKKWIGMIVRCYDKKFQEKHTSYKDVIVCEEWKCFQNFAQWFYEKYNPEVMEKYQLDKDLFSTESKIYSPENCVLVPVEINNLLHQKITLNSGTVKKGDKYSASIKINKSQVHLGMFNTIEEAFHTFKTAKEVHVREVAKQWRNKIDERVYQALINYKVEITDLIIKPKYLK